MNTKLKTVLYYLTACVPLFVMLAALPGLPEQIPLKYNFSGQIVRMGGKNELLLLPGLTILISAGLRLLEKAVLKAPRGEQNRRVYEFMSWSVTIFLGAVSLVMLYYVTGETQNIMQTRAMQILSLMISIMLVVMGNIMPKCKRTGSYWLNIGFRTPWTLRSDMVWTKTNRLGGYAMVGVGLAGIAASLLLPGWWGMAAVLGMLLIVLMWSLVYSWRLYKEETRDS